MTEQFIRSIAERYGLDVLKRITTGSSTRHFATFELSGIRVRDAWPAIHDAASNDQLKGGFVYMRASDIDFRPYVGIESVWCDCPESTVSA